MHQLHDSRRVGLRVVTNTTDCVVGCINKVEYKLGTRLLRGGDIDTSNGWQFSANCYNVTYEDLNGFEAD